MIGAASILQASVQVPAILIANIAPPSFEVNTSGGSYVTSGDYWKCEVSNGVPPYSYEWSVTNSEFALSNPDQQATDINVSATAGQTRSTVILCKVTDDVGAILPAAENFATIIIHFI